MSNRNNSDSSLGDNVIKDEKNEKEVPVNIGRYHDPDGITVEKLAFGYFMIKNKKNFRNIFYSFLILIGAITWPIFFYTFGKYIFFDMKKDDLMANDLVAVKPISHQVILDQMPKDIVIQEINILSSNVGQYDFVASITNPNKKYWLEMKFYFQYENEKTREETAFILPEETKRIVISGVAIVSRPTNSQLLFAKKNWHFFNAKTVSDYNQFSQDRIKFLVEDKKFTPAKGSILSEKVYMNSLDFTITNKSAYNYWQVPLNIALSTSAGVEYVKIFALEKFQSEEKRQVSLTFPGQIGTVNDIEILPDLNIFDANNYMNFTVPVDQTIKQ